MAAQVALKRQQAAEDAIALHLVSAESGRTYDYLPPGRIYGMQVTSPKPDSPGSTTEPQVTPQETMEEILVSPASLEMLGKLFPNKKRSVLELVLKRCNHDLLKAIEHFNLAPNKSENDSDASATKEEPTSSSAFKPVGSTSSKLLSKPLPSPHVGSSSFISSSKVFMHRFYPFLPLFNPQPLGCQPVLPNPVYVPGFCECEQCNSYLNSKI
ncbi:unnamed protein product [Brassicogethes aeneus]|uniref:DMA domain-containing protein n=1 Tax=Brassicogethes aeneus TaxID=1431903 RepID=A0A9P0B5N8_BRAAE|nr:unnamed protein product [Brassicogethes aeneus]